MGHRETVTPGGLLQNLGIGTGVSSAFTFQFPFFMFVFCVGSLVRITGQLCRILVPLIVVYLHNYKIESSHKFV